MYHHACIAFGKACEHGAEEAYAHSNGFAKQSQQPEKATVDKGHGFVVVQFATFDAIFLSLGWTVACNISFLKINHLFGTLTMQILARNKYNYFFCRCRSTLRKASFCYLAEHFGFGNVIKLPKLHVRTIRGKGSQFKTMFYFFGVEGFVRGKIAHRTPEIQYFFQIHVVVFCCCV
ncbi:hypothetical protein SDC9_188825 [bioreactor metagenome]|uniref:Uncharacterized protein n=1 Tax=bioreactor metagenome TaxID=1076179 RepID=A0A645HS16_9ZZZZ